MVISIYVYSFLETFYFWDIFLFGLCLIIFGIEMRAPDNLMFFGVVFNVLKAYLIQQTDQ